MKRIIRNGAVATALALGSTLMFGPTIALAAPTGPSATMSQGGADVIIANENGTNEALIGGGTVFELNGSGFQSVVGGQGGIYVAFGWVELPEDGKWTPSAGGENGVTYKFAPDDEMADNDGYLKFVTFPGGATEAAANGGVLDEDGTWATEFTVPTPQFESVDREGNPATVDCLEVLCGIVTIGAHNIKNANNESFTPVNFVDAYTPADSDGGEADGGDMLAESEVTDEPADDAADADGSADESADDAGTNADSQDTAQADSEATSDTAPEETAPNRAIQFGIVGAVLVVGVTVLRTILRRRSNG